MTDKTETIAAAVTATEDASASADAIADKALIRLDGIHKLMVGGVLLAILVFTTQAIAVFFVWATFRGPFKQIDELTQLNRAIISATCDSTLYTPEELRQRTPMQSRRLQIVCTHRRRLDSLAPPKIPASIIVDTVILPDTTGKKP